MPSNPTVEIREDFLLYLMNKWQKQATGILANAERQTDPKAKLYMKGKARTYYDCARDLASIAGVEIPPMDQGCLIRQTEAPKECTHKPLS